MAFKITYQSSAGVIKGRNRGFTLIELLVVISIIAMLIGILLPALGRARQEAQAMKCSGNLRSVGQAEMMYTQAYDGYHPPSYVYPNNPDNGDWNWEDQLMGFEPDKGYAHWTYYLFSSGNVHEDSFKCPAIDMGGHPATCPEPQHLKSGQISTCTGSVVDRQAPYCAYTANCAIMPRNKFFMQANGKIQQSALNHKRFVFARDSAISSTVILATEWHADHYMIMKKNGELKSHRPITPHKNPTGDTHMGKGGLATVGFPDSFQVTTHTWDDLLHGEVHDDRDPGDFLLENAHPLNAVGRHHPGGSGQWGGNTNFLYTDGHVERKNISETVNPPCREKGVNEDWGTAFYTLSGRNEVYDNRYGPCND